MTDGSAGPVRPAPAYVTLDGSLVAELLRPERGGSQHMSVAEAVVEGGRATASHSHAEADEVYYVLKGKGVVSLGENRYDVRTGSCIYIPAGQAHSMVAGGEGLTVLCVCAPPYSHEDTIRRDHPSRG